MSMRKSIGFIAAVILALPLLAGCTQSNSTASGTVEVDLPGNYSTGYTWSYTMDPEGVLTEQSSDYTTSDTTVTGAPGTQSYVFAATGDGTVTVTFSYARSWESDAPDSTATYQFSVEDGKIESTGVVEDFSSSLTS
jgi:predicted secreted protein